jgi:hypothetical protein
MPAARAWPGDCRAPDPANRPRGGRPVRSSAGVVWWPGWFGGRGGLVAGGVWWPGGSGGRGGLVAGQINLKLIVAKLRALAIFRLVARRDALPGGTPGNC